MGFLLADETRYEQKFKLIEQCMLSNEEASLFNPSCLCVHGTYGKSFKFFAKEGYCQYVSANPCTSAEVGKYYDVDSIVFQIIERDGKKYKKALLKSDLKVQ